MEIDKLETVKINAKTLSIYTKVSDRFTAQLISSTGAVIKDQDDGYVPSFMPGDHYGDYIILEIDIDTGMVTNWEQPTKESLENWIEPKE